MTSVVEEIDVADADDDDDEEVADEDELEDDVPELELATGRVCSPAVIACVLSTTATTVVDLEELDDAADDEEVDDVGAAVAEIVVALVCSATA
jgi:hypothetical protein